MRLPFLAVDAMLHRLSERLLNGELSLDDYLDEFDALVRFTGWTWDEFMKELDTRWTTRGSQPRTAFMC